MLIYVRVKNKTTMVSIEESDTVAKLKEKIKRKGISLKYKDLMFFDQKLASAKRLSEYGIKEKDTVYLTSAPINAGPAGFQLSVVLPSSEVTRLVVQANTSVLKVKQELSLENDLAIAKQILKSGEEEMANEKSLRDYDIKGDSVIFLEMKEDKKKRKSCDINLNCVRNIVGFVLFLIASGLLVWGVLTGRITKLLRDFDQSMNDFSKTVDDFGQSLDNSTV